MLWLKIQAQKIVVGQKTLFSMKEVQRLIWAVIWLLGLSLILAGLAGIYKYTAFKMDIVVESISSLIIGIVAFTLGAYLHDKT